ncbi:MAG: prolyl aminopeptidase [Lentisphaeraceae bacterium]|nr:prolyl aminopeptidase [Lentisphaeraceae bacterium]
MRELYPSTEPYNQDFIKVDSIHEVFYEESGNKNGKPVIFVHGGPGGGCSSDYRRYFDPKVYRIILFDQRGCGKSKPHACLENNTTWHLVADMEKIRETLEIEKWQVFGGSWGSTLGLTYAISHPERVTELVLRGIFMLRPSELRWFYQEGASYIFPDVWESYRDNIPEGERDDFIKAYYKRLTGENEQEKLQSAKAWSVWEGSTSRLITDPALIEKTADAHFALSFARIECHYFINGGFFETDSWILENVDKIQHIPTVIVQGRYDVVCPAKSAWELAKVLPESKLIIVPDAGHSAAESGILSALVEATDSFSQ